MSSCARSRGRGAVRFPALTGAALLLTLLVGCAPGGVEGASEEPHPSLARQAELSAVPQGARAPASGGKGVATVGASPRRSEGRGAELASVRDPAGDHGDGPRYADVVEVAFAESDRGLTITVTFAAVVPGRLARGEMEDVGVEVYRVSPLDLLLGQDGSDYRVHLDGGAQGWRAFLRTPDGYVDFPGRFHVTGRTLDVVLPWEVVGGRERAEAEVFVDWSSGVGRLATDGTERVRLLEDR